MFRELPEENQKVMETKCSKRVGEGVYGEVFYLSSSDDYVVKRAKTDDHDSGISYSSLREWIVCSQNRHYNLPKAIHIDTRDETIVFPHYGHTLKTWIRKKITYTKPKDFNHAATFEGCCVCSQFAGHLPPRHQT